MPLYNDSLGLDVFVENKWFVSFSSGPFVGIGKGIRNETYQWQAQPDGTGVISQNSQYKLVETDQKNYPVGFAAFANIGTKLTRGFGIAISPGVGVSIEDRPKPTYLIGPSFMFGEKQQLNISIGALFKKVEKFNPAAYPNLNTQFATKPSEVEYSSKFAPGGFLSISYTFFSYDRSKSVGSKSKK